MFESHLAPFVNRVEVVDVAGLSTTVFERRGLTRQLAGRRQDTHAGRRLGGGGRGSYDWRPRLVAASESSFGAIGGIAGGRAVRRLSP
eukprot:4280277-Prymnesium_polylepis.1